MNRPDVSVVIPTRHRAHLVGRAIESALRQTGTNLEVVVVIDGPDLSTTALRAKIVDPRVHWLELAEPQGGSGARNAGVQAACGEWIAFLDDDDEWRPNKLVRQLLETRGLDGIPILSCQVIARTERDEFIWPRKSPSSPLSEYLFCRSSLFQGEALMQTSCLLTKRELLLEIPFQAGLRKHQDWDWLLRAASRPGVVLGFVAEPLVVWHIEENRSSISKESVASASLEWLRLRKGLFTPRAYASFLLTIVTPQLIEKGRWTQVPSILVEAFRRGRPRAIDLFLFAGFCAIPRHTRHALRSRFA